MLYKPITNHQVNIQAPRCPFRKSSASFGPCFLAWLQVIYAAKLAA
jgi:hypothetical protein